MTERQLVTARTISGLSPITGADQIECATIDGWKVVVKKGEFKVGDPCAFFEIDSFLPASDTRFDFLSKSKRTWRGKEGYRLKTVKLRGQISQGLALPLTLFPEGVEVLSQTIQKWEEDVHPALAGMVKGAFPSFLRKTDQERLQNIYGDVDKKALYEVTLKMDGTSLTVYRYQGVFGVCSRNLELKVTDENAGNLYIQQSSKFSQIPEGFAVQAEICGPGIQGNRAALTSIDAYVFDIFDIQKGVYLNHWDRLEMCKKYGWLHVPSVAEPEFGPNDCLQSMEDALAYAERFNYLSGEPAEGVVFKRSDGGMSFKIISNKYLLKHGL